MFLPIFSCYYLESDVALISPFPVLFHPFFAEC